MISFNVVLLGFFALVPGLGVVQKLVQRRPGVGVAGCDWMDENGVVSIFIHMAFTAVVRGGSLKGPCVGVSKTYASPLHLLDAPLVVCEKFAEIIIVPLQGRPLELPMKTSADVFGCVGTQVCIAPPVLNRIGFDSAWAEIVFVTLIFGFFVPFDLWLLLSAAHVVPKRARLPL